MISLVIHKMGITYPTSPPLQYLQYIESIFHNLKTPFMNERNNILFNKVKPS
jgi:hypothetical protein